MVSNGRQLRWAAMLVAMASLVASTSTCPAQATQPAGQFDQLPLRRDPPRSAAPGDGNPVDVPASRGATLGWLDLTRLGASLGIVLLLVVGIAWGYRRLVGGAPAAKPSSAVRVLSRTVLAPRQQVLLLQVGRRVIVVGDSGGHFAALSEIRDTEEVTELLASSLGNEEAGEFARVFGQQQSRLDDLEATEHRDPSPSLPREPDGRSVEPIPETIRGEIGSLLARVRALSGQLKR